MVFAHAAIWIVGEERPHIRKWPIGAAIVVARGAVVDVDIVVVDGGCDGGSSSGAAIIADDAAAILAAMSINKIVEAAIVVVGEEHVDQVVGIVVVAGIDIVVDDVAVTTVTVAVAVATAAADDVDVVATQRHVE